MSRQLTADLVSLAENEGFVKGEDFDSRWGKDKMQQFLKENNVKFDHVLQKHVNPELHAEPSRPTVNLNELNAVLREYDAAGKDPLGLKRANEARGKLKKKLAHANDLESLAHVWSWERSRKVLAIGDEYRLNEVEAKKCTMTCECVRNIDASGHFEELGKVYPFSSKWDDDRQSEVYTVYIDRLIPKDDRLPKELGAKMLRGHELTEQDLDKVSDHVQVRRSNFRHSEFVKYFRPITE